MRLQNVPLVATMFIRAGGRAGARSGWPFGDSPIAGLAA